MPSGGEPVDLLRWMLDWVRSRLDNERGDVIVVLLVVLLLWLLITGRQIVVQ